MRGTKHLTNCAGLFACALRPSMVLSHTPIGVFRMGRRWRPLPSYALDGVAASDTMLALPHYQSRARSPPCLHSSGFQLPSLPASWRRPMPREARHQNCAFSPGPCLQGGAAPAAFAVAFGAAAPAFGCAAASSNAASGAHRFRNVNEWRWTHMGQRAVYTCTRHTCLGRRKCCLAALSPQRPRAAPSLPKQPPLPPKPHK